MISSSSYAADATAGRQSDRRGEKALALREQRFDLAAQFGIGATRLRQVCVAVLARAGSRLLVHPPKSVATAPAS
jgi:hypothetical protein